MSWTSFYIDYKKSGKVHKCPDCGKDNISVETTTNSVTFFCKDCGQFKHFDECKSDKK